MKSAEWRELLARLGRGQLRLLVSEIVIRECCRHYEESLDAVLRDFRRTAGRLDAHGLTPPRDEVSRQRDDLVSRYRDTLIRLLVDAGCTLLDLPDASHSEILNRDLARTKPFSANGKGYRDTLLWLTLVGYLRTADIARGVDVILVTKNHTDFCSGDGRLADNLLEEVAAISPLPVLCYEASISEVLKKLRERYADEDTELLESIQDLSGALLIAVTDAAEGLVNEPVADPDDFSPVGLPIDHLLPREVDDLTIEEVIVNDDTLTYDVYERYDGDTLAMHVSIDAEITFDGFIRKSEWYLADDEDLAVLDSDWNDHVMRIASSGSFRLSFQALTIGGEVSSIDFESGERL